MQTTRFTNNKFYLEVLTRHLITLCIVLPLLYVVTFDNMRFMEQKNQSAILAIVGLLMAAGVIGIFEATYQKTRLTHTGQRLLAHFTKWFIFIGVTELMLIAVAAVGTTSSFWDDPLLWALVPVYISLYLYDWWDALIAASES